MTSSMIGQIWRKRNGMKILDEEEHWRVGHLKESAHVPGYEDLLSRLITEINMICEPFLKKNK